MTGQSWLSTPARWVEARFWNRLRAARTRLARLQVGPCFRIGPERGTLTEVNVVVAIGLMLLVRALIGAAIAGAHGGWRQAKEAFWDFSLHTGVPLAIAVVFGGLLWSGM